MTTIAYQPIGIVHNPFEGIENVPIQPTVVAGIRGTVEVFAEFTAGLKDLGGFSHVILLYHFHRVTRARLSVIPFLDREPRGVFATRAPSRPNPIGLSIVRPSSIAGQGLHRKNGDILDGTPSLEIKPSVPASDHHDVERTSWPEMARESVMEKKSDGRFK